MAGTVKLMTSAGGGVVLDTATTTATDVTVKVPVTGVNNGTLVCSDSSGNVSAGTGNLSFNSGYGSVATAYGCRAWVNFNGTGTVAIRASGNVSSITDQATGTYTINFTNAMTDANYSGIVTSGFATGVREDVLGFAYTDAPYSMSASSYTVKFVRADTNAAVDTNFAMVSIFR